MKTNNSVKAFISVLVFGLLACSALSKVTPTVPPAIIEPTSPPASAATESNQAVTDTNELEIVSTFSFMNIWDEFHVVGEIKNSSNMPLTSIELSIEIKDAAGNSLLEGYDGNIVQNKFFSPLLDTLAVGESSPFSYLYDAENGNPDAFNVTITSSLSAEVDRAQMVVKNVQMVNDNSGSIIISGEIVNLSDQWAHIYEFAGAVKDANGQVVSTGWSGTFSSELAPKGDPGGLDRTPFSATITDPGIEYSAWEIYLDADVIEPPDRYPLKVDLVNHFFDDYDSFHIVGTVTNNSDEKLTVLLIAGLYDVNSIVLDAENGYLPVVIAPGDVIPFEISYFSNVNHNSDQADKIDSYTVQVDTYNTYPAYSDIVSLESLDATLQKDEAYWSFTGTISNTSGQALSKETVYVVIYDGSGQIAATEYTYIFPDGDVIAPGDVNSYELSLDVDALADMSDYTFQVFVQGDVK